MKFEKDSVMFWGVYSTNDRYKENISEKRQNAREISIIIMIIENIY